MSRKMPFVRFYPSDWIAGTRNLNLEEKGLYMEALNYMWSNGVPLPGNDRLAAKLLQVQALKYQKVMASLIAQGKMTRGDDVVFNERALRDIDAFQAFQAKQAERAHKGWATKKSIAGQVELYEGIAKVRASIPPTVPPQCTPPVHPPSVPGGYPKPTTPVAYEKANDFKGGFINGQSTGNAIPESTTRIHIESPKPPQGAFGVSALSARDTGHPDVTFENGVVTLVNGERAVWLQRFGNDDERLSLALIEVAHGVQWASSRPVASQVFQKLARMAGDKRERDTRYQSTVKVNAKPSSRPGAPVESLAEFNRREAERFARLKTKPSGWEDAT